MTNPVTPDELQKRISACATSREGNARVPDGRTVEGTLTAITSKWFLGGRKVTNNFRCVLDQDSGVVHFRETAVESSWGMPPPTLTVETSSQCGSRVRQARTDKAVGGGGRLDFGQFREDVEKVANESGWKFVHELV